MREGEVRIELSACHVLGHVQDLRDGAVHLPPLEQPPQKPDEKGHDGHCRRRHADGDGKPARKMPHEPEYRRRDCGDRYHEQRERAVLRQPDDAAPLPAVLHLSTAL